MNNIDRIKDYIQDAYISPLERLMNGDNEEHRDGFLTYFNDNDNENENDNLMADVRCYRTSIVFIAFLFLLTKNISSLMMIR